MRDPFFCKLYNQNTCWNHKLTVVSIVSYGWYRFPCHLSSRPGGSIWTAVNQPPGSWQCKKNKEAQLNARLISSSRVSSFIQVVTLEKCQNQPYWRLIHTGGFSIGTIRGLRVHHSNWVGVLAIEASHNLCKVYQRPDQLPSAVSPPPPSSTILPNRPSVLEVPDAQRRRLVSSVLFIRH